MGVIQKLLKDDGISESERIHIVQFFDEKVLGLKLFLKEENTSVPAIPTIVEELKAQREVAKQNRNWEKADQLRDEIKALGWSLQDTAQGQQLEFIR